jgi:hypothetical protein
MSATDGAQHLSRFGGSGNLRAVSLYHRSSELAAVIVTGVADPNFEVRLRTLGVEAIRYLPGPPTWILRAPWVTTDWTSRCPE